jgi:pimeloyl-ACP methyl ester carboxylesterase
LAAQIHALAEAIKLERPYVVGHDLGAHVTYAYVRRFPDALRGDDFGCSDPRRRRLGRGEFRPVALLDSSRRPGD